MWQVLPGSTGICFRRPDSKPWIYSQFQRKFRSTLEKLDLPSALYSTHSFRRGGATFAFLCGIPTEIIKLLGGWKTDTYFRYIEFPLEAKTSHSVNGLVIQFQTDQLIYSSWQSLLWTTSTSPGLTSCWFQKGQGMRNWPPASTTAR